MCAHPFDAHRRLGFCLIDGCGCKSFFRKDLPNKLHAKKTEYAGITYHSGLEARVAADLDYRLRAGDIKAVERQVCYELIVNGQRICRHYVDFRLTHHDGTVELVEAKGFATNEWKIKRDLLLALYVKDVPGISYRVERG